MPADSKIPIRTAFSARAVLLAPALLLAPPVMAAEAGGEAAGEILVTGRGLDLPPAAAAYDSVEIGRERLNASASGRIEDALSAVAGFQQFRRSDSRAANPSAQGVTLRALGGNATSRTLVLLDGVPQADPFFGYVPLSSIDPGQLAAVRVTRGGGAGAFGSGAVAGTIELFGADPAALGLVQGQAMVNDRGETALSASVAPRLGQGFAVLSGRWDRGQGFWTTPVAQRTAASVRAAYRSWSTGLRMAAPVAPDIELQARVALFDDARTLRFAGADSGSSGQDASLRLVGRGAWAFEVLGYVQARDFSNVVISSTTFRKTLDQNKTPTTGLGGKLELRPPVGGGHLPRLGADWRLAEGTAHESAYNGATGALTARRSAGGRNVDLGLYAEDDWTIGALVLTGGVRADRWSIGRGLNLEYDAAGNLTRTASADRSGWSTTFRGGAVLTLAPGTTLRGSAYSGLRQPTLNELYRAFTVTAAAPSGGTVTTRTLANPDLGNERLEGYELGLDLAPVPALNLSLTLFDNRVRHAIANVTTGVVGTTTTRKRFNVDAVRARGAEIGAELKQGAFSLTASLALTDAKVEASGIAASLNGLRPAQTPRVAASATAAWSPGEGRRLALTLRHTGAQYEDDLQTDVLAAATTLDAYAEWPLGRGLSLVLRGENLTDTAVITRNQSGSIDLGAPRSGWVGFKARY
jgi:outer membrane receptor protein involved in Fe transport